MLKVIPFIYKDEDDLCANTYLIIDEENNALVVDPSSIKDGVINYIKRENLSLKGILLTHGHIDHFRGVLNIVNNFNCDVYISYLDASFLSDSYYNCSLFLGKEETYNREVKTLADNEIITLLKDEIRVIFTPYHTEGSVCFYSKVNNILFSGDSLFKNSIGRYDLPTSNFKKMKESLEKLMALPKETKVYPGHGQFTTIGNESR
jgi:glyoxylase-like metal-dependent hydrolase (beta-lactamase superfamily II)